MHDTTRELRLAAALVEAADTLTEDFEATVHLRRVADHCVELLAARAAGIMFVDGERAVALAGSSGAREVALDLLRAQSDGGPCLESYGSGRPVAPVSVRAAHAEARWPAFTGAALGHGITTTFAVPLRRHGTALGALNVFAADGDDRGDGGEGVSAGWGPELSVAQALADAVAVGLANHRGYTQYRTLSAQLQEALSSRVRIEQAKGMLAERWSTGTVEAFTALRRYARCRRLPLDQVASGVVDGVVDDAELRAKARGPSGRGRL
ncbi:GAF and ANTAR domain-containing protein [Streptomyces pseudovenezuelae]|uniref:GAF domain-containing protein n=1 Tax=Streptomyces pseudovenezuelae TaxID=67350 RepID=A0ABT6LI30_9ACTN|nr:GAF and ANTAR domain-containing protein [Streptomyces pseudovenezuelae]MDH6215967.1 GAF domain-containing protein [Streptomyces pseudovenezuelae]